MLDICKISLEYPCHKIIEDLSFHVYSGEIIGSCNRNSCIKQQGIFTAKSNTVNWKIINLKMNMNSLPFSRQVYGGEK